MKRASKQKRKPSTRSPRRRQSTGKQRRSRSKPKSISPPEEDGSSTPSSLSSLRRLATWATGGRSPSPVTSSEASERPTNRSSSVSAKYLYTLFDRNRSQTKQTQILPERVRQLITSDNDQCDVVLYWMMRDQRVQDNWAALYARQLADKYKCPMIVCFCLTPSFPGATLRAYDFMLMGLEEVAEDFEKLHIPFHLLTGNPEVELPKFIKDLNVRHVVVDFSPLRTSRQWINGVGGALSDKVHLDQVDAHNIVPCWIASDKQEYGARTIRRKITDKLGVYLTEYSLLARQTVTVPRSCQSKKFNVGKLLKDHIDVDRTVESVKDFVPGYKAAVVNLASFINCGLKDFDKLRNNPNEPKHLSCMSPYFHFGHISVQRCILHLNQLAKKTKSMKNSVATYLEEAVIRRELSDNFCFYQRNYDNIKGASNWAQVTLREHSKDKREHLYGLKQLEAADTHDELWNAAQIEMKRDGKMHGFMRMYWAKKILEWSASPEAALKNAIFLNDKYNLDGRDPNGYVGCMWSICGLHDRGWAERPVFGKIRYMNLAGCKRKFDVAKYVSRFARSIG